MVLSDPGAGDFTVRADVADGESVGSVFFELTGPVTATRTESWAPFALHGDNGTDDLHGGGPLPVGDYTLTATAYSSKYRRGDTLGTLAVSLTITADPDAAATGAGPLAGFRLVDAADQAAVAALADGDSVALADPDGGSYALVADIAEGETAGSVRLTLAGPSAAARVENHAPYSLHGDNNNHDDLQLRGQTLPEGRYTLTATAYAQPDRGGGTLGAITATFNITDGAKPSDLRLEGLHNALKVSYDRPITGAPDHFLIEWRALDEDYSSDRSVTATGTERTVKGLENGTYYMVRVSPVGRDGAVHTGVEGSGQPKHFRDYIEEHFIAPNVDAFPWLQEAWYDQPIEIEFKNEQWAEIWGIDGGYLPEGKILLTFGSYRNMDIVLHSLAHHYSITNDIHLGDVEGRLAVLSGWLRLAEEDTRDKLYDVYADALSLRVTDPDSYKSGSTMDEVMHHAGQGTVPQWFYDTYSSDGTLDGVDHDLLWADMRKLRCLKGTSCRELGGRVAEHARGLFGGLCSMDEARSVLWGSTVYHSPWIDGGCNNRRPQELTATLIADPDDDDETDDAELEVSWSAPLYTTTPAIDRYVVQWKSGTQSYDTTRREIVTDLSDLSDQTRLSHTVTGLSPDTAYTVRVAAVNSADTADFDDDDGRTRTAETAAVASTDATLSALSLSGLSLNEAFAPDTTAYTADADASVAGTRVSAVARHSSATVDVSPGDAEGAEPGHQVSLEGGETVITVTVTAQDGATTKQYTITITRAQPEPVVPPAGFELAALNSDPAAIWSDGATMWVVDTDDDKLYAYSLADGSHEESSDIDLAAGNEHPAAIWSDGATMWVLDTDDDKLYAYTAATGKRKVRKDITLAGVNGSPRGIWSDGTTMWVVDYRDEVMYAYVLATDARDASKDTSLHSDSDPAVHLDAWADDTAYWVVDWLSQKIYAHSWETGALVGARHIAAPGSSPVGIWSDGAWVWIADDSTDSVTVSPLPSG